MIHLTSDLHWKHDNIRHMSKRPFDTIEDMDQILIKNWNEAVAQEDVVYCLGDVSLTKDRVYLERIFSRLNGTKFLVPGNHDHWLKHHDLQQYWTVLPALTEVTIKHPITDKEKLLVLSHFPLLTWNRASRGSWMLHGHSHGNLEDHNKGTTRMDVGVDCAGRRYGVYRPFSLLEIAKIMDAKAYDPVDHHGSQTAEM